MKIKIEEYLPLIKKIAGRYKDRGVELEDLIQEGFIGLMEAKNRYNENLNVPFFKYSIYWIKKQMIEAIMKNSRQKIHMNSGIIEIIEKNRDENEFLDAKNVYLENLPEIEKVILEKLFIEEKTLEEVANELKMSRERIRQMKQKAIMRLKNFNKKLIDSLN